MRAVSATLEKRVPSLLHREIAQDLVPSSASASVTAQPMRSTSWAA
jgi:hypothetical protein